MATTLAPFETAHQNIPDLSALHNNQQRVFQKDSDREPNALMGTSSHQITLRKWLSPVMVRILEQVGHTVQQTYDISPMALRRLIDDDFQKKSQQLFEELEEKLARQFDIHPEVVRLTSFYHHQPKAQLLNELFGAAKEGCGYLYHRAENGYAVYCNATRSHHVLAEKAWQSDGHLEIPCEVIPPPPYTCHPHEFCYKTYQQLLDERFFKLRQGCYRQFLAQVSEAIHHRIEVAIQRQYAVWRYQSSPETVAILIAWLKEHPSCFKSRYGILDRRTDYSYVDLAVPHDLGESPPPGGKLLRENASG